MLFLLCLPISAFICLSFVNRYPIDMTFTLDNVKKLMHSGIRIYLINSMAMPRMIPQPEGQSFIEGTAIVSLMNLMLNLLEKAIAFSVKRWVQKQDGAVIDSSQS